MSVENAIAFYKDIATDKAFRDQMRNAANDEERDIIMTEAGYNFTPEDWDAALEQLQQQLQQSSQDGELIDDDLEAVTGGIQTIAIYSDLLSSRFQNPRTQRLFS